MDPGLGGARGPGGFAVRFEGDEGGGVEEGFFLSCGKGRDFKDWHCCVDGGGGGDGSEGVVVVMMMMCGAARIDNDVWYRARMPLPVGINHRHIVFSLARAVLTARAQTAMLE